LRTTSIPCSRLGYEDEGGWADRDVARRHDKAVQCPPLTLTGSVDGHRVRGGLAHRIVPRNLSTRAFRVVGLLRAAAWDGTTWRNSVETITSAAVQLPMRVRMSSVALVKLPGSAVQLRPDCRHDRVPIRCVVVTGTGCRSLRRGLRAWCERKGSPPIVTLEGSATRPDCRFEKPLYVRPAPARRSARTAHRRARAHHSGSGANDGGASAQAGSARAFPEPWIVIHGCIVTVTVDDGSFTGCRWAIGCGQVPRCSG
jgi:hypothetical protein